MSNPLDLIAFDDPLPANVDANALLGGKGANLVEMARTLGLPVPPGFIISTNVCRRFLESGWPDGLDAAIDAHVARLGERLGQGFGSAQSPLLVSVRSGAPVSMPGMMDTLLNVGMTPAIRERLAVATGDAVFAADTWLRFCRMYAEIVLGVDREKLQAASTSKRSAPAVLAAADRVRTLALEAGGIPEAPIEQLRGAVAAVFRSWQSERARVFRAHEGISEATGTAVTVQAMVFGNLDDASGTGVVFTRDPATGDARPFGDYLPRAQGEDVVAGTHAVLGLGALREQLPKTYDELMAHLDRLEHHYRDMCDVEFTVSQGRLYLLQTRIGRRSTLAAVRMAVQMAEDPAFPLTRPEAVARVDQAMLQQLAVMSSVSPAAVPAGTGLAASPGVGVGALCFQPDQAAELAAAGTPVVLVREETSPADVHGMVAAAGLVTLRGGVVSHAAVVARSWSIPAITSLADAELLPGGLKVGSTTIAVGALVTVDGTSGALYAGDQRSEDSVDLPEVRAIREWAASLGVEPGAVAAATTSRRTTVELFELVRAVELKGLCSAARAATSLATDERYVEDLIGGNPDFFRATPRGVAITPAARAWVKERLDEERRGADLGAVNACYHRFLPLNDRFKQIVSGWQLSAGGGHPPEELVALGNDVAALHADFIPILTEMSGHYRRLVTFPARFEQALQALRAGDASMLASPLKDSYHTVWFEYHEELIALSGRDRAVEEAAEMESQSR